VTAQVPIPRQRRGSGRLAAILTGWLALHAVAGQSDHYGTQQERLSGVPGAHVRIKTLRDPDGHANDLIFR
jgi:hypothetical protein